MAFINKHDTNGTKGLLSKGELGYDDYSAGGDTGRVYVGTGTENIALAERLEANMMTKAQFNALAEERRMNRAGSGFDSFGENQSMLSGYQDFINNGIAVTKQSYLNPIIQGNNRNLFAIGSLSSPIINGVKHLLSDGKSVFSNPDYGLSHRFDEGNNKGIVIELPTAPTIYPYDTVLTAEQINSGVIKHADASNSGLIVNGKFDTDTSGWVNVAPSRSTISWDSSGKLKMDATAGDGQRPAVTHLATINFIIGKKYILEYTASSPDGGIYTGFVNGTTFLPESGNTKGLNRLEFTATGSTIQLYGSVLKTTYFDNIAVYPADAISRSDLSFLESWHEDISEKNFVYPLGNVQYLGGNTDGLTGIANGAFTGFETYSLKGNWQTPSSLIGKGYVWSSLTEAQKKAFIANPENNCYLDGDKTIQVRYKIRVVQGLGDNWANIDPQNKISAYLLASTGFYVVPKGKLTSIPISSTNGDIDYGLDTSNGGYANSGSTWANMLNWNGNGHFIAIDSYGDTNGFTAGSYNGQCFALPIALIHRRNQGMYHPVYNQNGSKKASDSSFWYNTAVSFTSISDCFDPAKLLTASGYIGTVSGRPDGLFYDQIHEGDIQDLRNSSKKVEDKSRLISREFNKLVSGTTRGTEREWGVLTAYPGTVYTHSENSLNRSFHTSSTSGVAADFYNNNLPAGTNVILVNPALAKAMYGTISTTNGHIKISNNIEINRYETKTISTHTIGLNSYTDGWYIYAPTKSTRTKSNTLLHCDIIGNPANYPTAWKESGVFGTPLIVAEDGTSLLPDGTLDTFKLSRPVKTGTSILLALRSTNNGTTWSSFTPTFSTTTNAITLTDEPATNLVMVYYKTHTSMAVPTVNSEVLEIGDVIISNYYTASKLQESLINKINTHSNASVICVGSLGLSTYTLEGSKFVNGTAYIPIEHPNSNLGSSTSPLCKVFPYLTRKNGKAYLNLVFKEMKHNGTSWGDDNKFNIVDNVSTTTDLNAQTVLIGQKTVELPYFIAGDE